MDDLKSSDCLLPFELFPEMFDVGFIIVWLWLFKLLILLIDEFCAERLKFVGFLLNMTLLLFGRQTKDEGD